MSVISCNACVAHQENEHAASAKGQVFEREWKQPPHLGGEAGA